MNSREIDDALVQLVENGVEEPTEMRALLEDAGEILDFRAVRARLQNLVASKRISRGRRPSHSQFAKFAYVYFPYQPQYKPKGTLADRVSAVLKAREEELEANAGGE